MPKSIDDRIASALADGARVADINSLIADIAAEAATANEDAERLDALSLAITTPEADADAAVDAATKARRKAARLSAKVEGLRDRVKELEESNRQKAAAEAYAAAQKTRDELAADLKEQWPQLTGAMIALLDRIKASDAECTRVAGYGRPALVSAEALARGCNPTFVLTDPRQDIPRLADIRIPGLAATNSHEVTYGIWPRRPAA